jgi:LPXTG-motif cell wall-anchored protein
VTRAGPTRLAFTGGEPIMLGAAGAALMLAGLGLHLRRRRGTQGPLA